MNPSLKATDNNIEALEEDPCDAWGDEFDVDEAASAAQSSSMSSAITAALALPSSPAPIPFPFCNKPDHVPGLFTRSALFRVERIARGVGAKNDSSHFVKAPKPYAISVDGPMLAISDKRVFDAVVRLAKQEKLDLNEPLRTSLREIASRMGLTSTGGHSLSWVNDSLERLSRTRVTFRLLDGSLHEGSMLASVDKGPAGVLLGFDSKFILPAFGLDKQFRIDAKRRASLPSPLTQWMHDFISTHTVLEDLTLDYLRELCGYGGRVSSFPHSLRASMDALVGSAPEIAASFDIVKLGRDSDHWTLKVQRGSEPANFFNPAAMKSAAAAKAPSAARRGPRKGGVAL
jgi:hypothetical protein